MVWMCHCLNTTVWFEVERSFEGEDMEVTAYLGRAGPFSLLLWELTS